MSEEIVTVTGTRSQIVSLVEDAWSDSVSRTSERFLEKGSALGMIRSAPAPAYVHGSWTHFFDGPEGGESDRECRFVFDVEKQEVTHLEIRRGTRMERGSRSERADLTESLVNANASALSNPAGWDLEGSSELPDWAA